MDWSNWLFQVSASRPLDSGMSAADHPRALRALEQELWSLIEGELAQLAWDHNGSLADLIERQPKFRLSIKNLASSLDREWSRLSIDRKSIIAEYSVNLAGTVMDYFPPEEPIIREGLPIGGIPLPEDPWTGIVIYAPQNLPLWGTGLNADPQPALRARILSTALGVLADPAIQESGNMKYSPLDQREEIDHIVGRRPYRAVARALYGDYPCDIILGEEDTRRIMASKSSRQALLEGRIAILFDS